MSKYDNQKDTDEHNGWLQELGAWQESDLDQRQQAREADRFLLDKDGQWEESVAKTLDTQQRPRYTFDQVTPTIEFIMADIEDMDFGSSVKPTDGEATEETADTYEGMIRSIEARSDATDVYRNVIRRVIRRGFDAVRVRAGFSDEWSFDQDLTVESIPNAINRVWTSNTITKSDSSDTDAAYVLTSVSPEDYKEQFPDGQGVSIDDSDLGEHWDQYRPEVIIFGERYYKKSVMREIAQLSNGNIVEMDDEFDKVKDEMAEQGITIARTKKIKDYKIYHRFFDGHGMISPETETAFKSMPIITFYGNFELLGEASKVSYHGMVLKLMDYQRVYNYAQSREIEEGALAPRDKTWMTTGQAKGHERQLSAMNTSSDPIQFYNNEKNDPIPFKTSPNQINPHLANLSVSMTTGIQAAAGVNNAMNGDFAGRMSAEAMNLQIDRGAGASRKWVNALVKGIRRVCEVLVETIPVVYDTKRQFMILGEDGKEEMVTLNDEIFDRQTQQMVRVNTLNSGKYKVICSAGQAFSNRQEAGLAAMLKYAEVDPAIIQTGGDLMLKSIDAPLVDTMAERKRMQLVQAGVIPYTQLTDEEKEMVEAQASQPKEPDAGMVMAQAEMKKADADLLEQENRRAEIGLKAAKLEQEGYKISLGEQKQQADIGKTRADTIKSLAQAEEVTHKSIGQQVNNLQSVTPGVQ